MPERYCAICLDPHPLEGEAYHQNCCRELFGSNSPPALPFSMEQLNEMAEKIVRRQVTVPGVQPKLSLHLEKEGTGKNSRLTLVGLEGDFILKPPSLEYPEMPELEHLTMRLARCFGLTTAHCGLLPLAHGDLGYITRRMDRSAGKKLHMEDMCQLTDRLTEQKYRGSLENVGKAIIRFSSNPMFDVGRLLEVVIFCFLTGNSDMHLKNFSLIYSPEGEVNLAPSYDLLPTQLLLPTDTEETALTLNGRKKKLQKRDFEIFAGTLRLTPKQVENIWARFSKNLPSAAHMISRGYCSTEMKERFLDLFQRRALRLELAD